MLVVQREPEVWNLRNWKEEAGLSTILKDIVLLSLFNAQTPRGMVICDPGCNDLLIR